MNSALVILVVVAVGYIAYRFGQKSAREPDPELFPKFPPGLLNDNAMLPGLSRLGLKEVHRFKWTYFFMAENASSLWRHQLTAGNISADEDALKFAIKWNLSPSMMAIIVKTLDEEIIPYAISMHRSHHYAVIRLMGVPELKISAVADWWNALLRSKKLKDIASIQEYEMVTSAATQVALSARNVEDFLSQISAHMNNQPQEDQLDIASRSAALETARVLWGSATIQIARECVRRKAEGYSEQGTQEWLTRNTSDPFTYIRVVEALNAYSS